MPEDNSGKIGQSANWNLENSWTERISLESSDEPKGAGSIASHDNEPKLQGRDFSNYNRELCQQIDPGTGIRMQLLTRKQYAALRLKELKDFGE